MTQSTRGGGVYPSSFLDAIASPRSYPCQSLSEWVIVSDLEIAIASPGFASLFRTKFARSPNTSKWTLHTWNKAIRPTFIFVCIFSREIQFPCVFDEKEICSEGSEIFFNINFVPEHHFLHKLPSYFLPFVIYNQRGQYSNIWDVSVSAIKLYKSMNNEMVHRGLCAH